MFKPNYAFESLSAVVADAAKSSASVVSVAVDLFNHRNGSALSDFTAVAHNQAIVLVSDQLTHNPITTDLLKFTLNIYAGYVLQSIELLNKVGSINVRDRLDQVNPNRSSGANPFSPGGVLARESHALYCSESMMDYPTYRHTPPPPSNIALENYKSPYYHMLSNRVAFEGVIQDTMDDLAEIRDAIKGRQQADDNPDDRPAVNVRANGENQKQLAIDGSALAQGKILSVTIVDGKDSVSVPVIVGVSPIFCTGSMITGIFAGKSVRNNWLARIRRIRTGELSAIGDGVLLNDVFKDKARALREDKKGISIDMAKRRATNAVASVMSGKTSLGTACSVAIISSDVARQLELTMGAPLDNPSVRDKLFKEGGMFMLVVVNEGYETLKMYHRGQRLSVDLTFKQCRVANKGDGPDIKDIMLAFVQGKAPTF